MRHSQTTPSLSNIKRLFAIDPGSRCTGVAFFEEWPLAETTWQLRQAFAVKIKQQEDVLQMAASVAEEVSDLLLRWRLRTPGQSPLDSRSYVVIEYPQEQKQRQGFVRANDILLLSHTTGLILSRLQPDPRHVSRIHPETWKKRIPKPSKARRAKRGTKPYIIEERCRRILEPYEIDKVLLPAPTWQSDVWDAVGLGLWAVNRCRAGCVPK